MLYRPGFGESARAWLVYLWHLRRRALGWLVVFVLLDLLLLLAGHSDWRIWLSLTLCVAVPALSMLLPLAFRLLWAYKVRQLGVHELFVEDDGLFVQGTGIRLGAAWAGYSGFAEQAGYFFLVRPTGLFSFIPKHGLTPEMTESIRTLLRAKLTNISDGKA